MRYDLTPAAERAVQAAAGSTDSANSAALDLPALLLGLLAEPECRAAQQLIEHGVSSAAVREKWNALRVDDSKSPGVIPRTLQIETVLRAAEDRLYDYQRPLALATEHLLLGLAASPSDVADWLSSQGLRADDLEAEIHRRSGHERGPIAFDDDLSSTSAALHAPQPSALSPQPSSSNQVLRILDAAANRTSEGLRVIEDYIRFVLDDRHLTEQLKHMRHELAAALSGFAISDRLAARESQADVGATTKTAAEFSRTDATDVVTASFQRVQQALRSLEEFAKLTDPVAAATIERLRYRSYTLQRALDATRVGRDRLQNARLYVLIDGRSSEVDFKRLAEQLVAAKVDVLQLRDKQLADRELLARARLLRSLTRNTDTLFIMNDRPDLAALSDADGVHVGQEELTIKDARQIIGPSKLIGVSTHSIEQARQAVLDGANYLGVGPTFASATKQFANFPGLDFVRAVSAEIALPCFAIGGITATNLPEVLAAGAKRVAVSNAVTNAVDSGAAVQHLKTLLN